MRTLLIQYFAVGCAGFFGAILRVAMATAFDRFGLKFPLGILLVNVGGSFFLGWFVTYAAGRELSDLTKLAIGAGFVGAFTTFSTLMLDTTRLADEGAGWMATINLIGSLALGLLAVRLGMTLAGRA